MTSLGTVLPGSGLLLSGARVIGGLLLAAFVGGILAIVAWVYVKSPTGAALYLGVRPNLLLAILVGGITLLAVVALSVIATAVLNWPSRPQTGKRFLAGLFTTLLVAVIIAPAAPAVQYVMIHRDLVGSLFSHPTDHAVDPGTGRQAWADQPRVNVMLIGSDAYPGREGIRTDSMMVASVDTVTGDSVLFGVPRNLENVPFGPGNPLRQVYPDGYDCGRECLMNGVWDLAEEHRDLFPGDPMPGLTATRLTLSEVLGLRIDYSVVVDIRGFSAFVDAMGGVDVTVRERIPIGGRVSNGRIVPGSINGWIEEGPQHLNGYEAMWFARSRATTDDFDRMARQRCMVGALVDQMNPAKLIDRYPELAAVAKDHVYTDVPPAHLPAWAELVTRMQDGTIRSLPFTSQIIDVTDPDFREMRWTVQDAISDRPTEATPTPTPTPTDGTQTPDDVVTPAPQDEDETVAPTDSPEASPTSTGPQQGLVKVRDAC
ncbi:MAG: LCP family protein [Mobilicoccus sp.]|nr:LCP family protein [Mobilicoccus sp.]